MKRKELWVLFALLILAVLVVCMTHYIFDKPREEQLRLESQLPYGDYLPDSQNPLIRVVLKTKGFLGIAHPEVKVTAEHGICINGTRKEEPITIKPDDELFREGSIIIETNYATDKIEILSLTRGCGIPSYGGKMELYSTAEGIVIVNEIPLEEYLCGVVPSEMPASYEMEALKCQAVCARSYAYCQMLQFSYPEYQAHVDDSVSFQVYGNSGEKESTTKAVKQTAGKKLWYMGNVVKTYYYSTSSGHSTDINAWGSTMTEERQYLKGVAICDEDGNDYEESYPWYRWKATITKQLLQQLIENNMGKTLGELQSIEITKRGVGNVALQVVVKGSKETITVNTENKIRSLFGGDGYHIEKQDGSIVKSTKLLPSAFFTIAKNEENYIIEGGGYGHGIGMSQNGANEMAKDDMTYKDILQFFYPGAKVD